MTGMAEREPTARFGANQTRIAIATGRLLSKEKQCGLYQ
jgi:hypothetical protein